MNSTQLDAKIGSLFETIQNAGSNKSAQLAKPANVLPANVLLELTGESVRGRVCSFTTPDGEEYCMRPDMTAPIALDVATGVLQAQRYIYSGAVYRVPQRDSGDGIEFNHTGFEWFGGAGGYEEDAEGLALTEEALIQAGVSDLSLTFGDSGLFFALIDALKLDAPWPERLRKAFNRRHGPRELIEASEATSQRTSLSKALSGLNETDAVAAVEEVFSVSGISPVGGRDAAEIAKRLRTLVRADAQAIPDKAKQAIFSLMGVKTTVRQAVDEIAKIAKTAGVKLDVQLDAFVKRIECLDGLGVKLMDDAVFDAEFGRRFDYYDGIVFKVSHGQLGASFPLATGGRYDGLVGALSSGAIHTKAFGVALRADRILAVAK